MDYRLVYHIVCSGSNHTLRFGRKLAFELQQGFKMGKRFSKVIIISKALEWLTLLFFRVDDSDLCIEPIQNQIKIMENRSYQ